MKTTKMEEVTRTFCDVCGTEITHRNQHGIENRNICMETNQYNVAFRNGNDLRVSCETLAKLYLKYPELANAQFAKTFGEN